MQEAIRRISSATMASTRRNQGEELKKGMVYVVEYMLKVRYREALIDKAYNLLIGRYDELPDGRIQPMIKQALRRLCAITTKLLSRRRGRELMKKMARQSVTTRGMRGKKVKPNLCHEKRLGKQA